MATTIRQRPKPNKPAPPSKRPITSPNKNRQPVKGELADWETEDDDQGMFGTPTFVLIDYGPPGVGKTSMWAHMDECGFIIDSKEEGIKYLYKTGQCPKPAWLRVVNEFDEADNSLMDTLAQIANKEHPIKNLVIDSMTGMQNICFAYHCAKYFNNDWTNEGFFSYMKGPKNAAATDWPRLLDAIDEVRRAGHNVAFIGHSQTKDVNNPGGADYAQFMPVVDKEIWAQTNRWAKAIFFHNYDITLEMKGKKAKASGGEDRQLYTTPQAAYVAKNLWGLEPIINLGGTPKEAFDAFVDDYKRAWGK